MCIACGNDRSHSANNFMQVLQGEFIFDDLPPPHKPTLASEFPNLAAEWDFEKNGDLTPDQVSPHSGKKVWWKCRNCGQSWKATIDNRSRGSGCPYDTGRLPIPGETDLATLCPEIAAEWDYEKNTELSPVQVFRFSNKQVWWKCKGCGKSWKASIKSRSKGSMCPYDTGRLPIPGKTDLATLHPNLAAEWDYERNKNLTPDQLAEFSNKKVWWKCRNCGQSWKAVVNSRSRGVGCPYDAGRLPITGKTDLETLRPDLSAEWDYEKNGNLTPNHVSASSGRRVWWKCRICKQSWQATINDRAKGNGCPYDAGRMPIPGKTDLATLYPDLALEWDCEKNGDLSPEQVTAYSGKKIWWRCKKCGQSWQAPVYSRTNGFGCPYDAGHLPIVGRTDLATLRPDLAAQWDHEMNGQLEPTQLTVRSGKKVWWRCENCGQSWQATIYNRSKGNGCPYDAGKLPIPGKTDLETLRPDLVAEWDFENNIDLLPNNFTVSSGRKVWWKCKNCGQHWQASVANRVKGSGCPYDTGRLAILGKTDLTTQYPNLAAEWDYEKNGEFGPENFSAKSKKKKWWKCKNCGRSWYATIRNRTNGSRCPHCK